MRIGRHRISEREGAIGGQFDQQSLRDRLDAVILVFLRFGRLSADRDDGALDDGLARRSRFDRRCRFVSVLDHDRGFVLWTDVAAIDCKHAFGIDADENAGNGDLGRIVADGTSVKRLYSRFQLAEALIDLVGQLVGAFVFLREPIVFGLQGGVGPGSRTSLRSIVCGRCHASMGSRGLKRRRPDLMVTSKTFS
jgi:hypothetical protein